MTDEEQKTVFANNLNKLIEQSGKDQKTVAMEIGFEPTTFNTWCMGKIMPSFSKIRQIADYFHVGVTHLTDEEPDPRTWKYYLNDEAAEMAQELFDNPDTRMLFDAARGSKPENLRLAAEMLKRFKETNNDT